MKRWKEMTTRMGSEIKFVTEWSSRYLSVNRNSNDLKVLWHSTFSRNSSSLCCFASRKMLIRSWRHSLSHTAMCLAFWVNSRKTKSYPIWCWHDPCSATCLTCFQCVINITLLSVFDVKLSACQCLKSVSFFCQCLMSVCHSLISNCQSGVKLSVLLSVFDVWFQIVSLVLICQRFSVLQC